MMKKLSASLLLLAVFTGFFSSCKKDDPPLPPNTANFQAASAGLTADQTEATITIALSRSEQTDQSVTISYEATGIVYGTGFTTTPAAAGTNIVVNVPAGSASASFKVTRLPDVLLAGTESVKFTISGVGTGLQIGSVKESILNFSQIISEGSNAFVLAGKTSESNYANSVFVDLSNNFTTLADRKSWNLGFKSGTDFKVILNHAYQSVAGVTTKVDINDVTIADTAGIDLNFPPGGGTLSNVDDWKGDLSKTAIAEIAANDDENKVYLIASESSRATKSNWFKVKITRSGDGYKVQYARLSETAIKTLTIPKKADYNFTFASLENDAIVDVEPKAASWDIEWSYSTYDSGLGTPYWFQDFILLNYIAGVQAAEVLVKESDGVTAASEATTITKFDAFAEADLASLTYLNTRDAIGSKWRVTTGTGIKRDRFYVVKDPAGNVYKLRFIKMGVGDTGERGKPEIDFKLIKKA